MTALIRALHAESLKLRGTLALAMCVVAPLAIAVLNMAMIGSHGAAPANMSPDTAWTVWARNSYALWGLLMLPLFVTLEAALLAQLEHANHQWKHLLALPLPRAAHYLAKWLALTAMSALATALLAVLCVLSGWALQTMAPGFHLVGLPPLRPLLRIAAGVTLASSLIVGIHTWVSLRWRSFTVAVSLGIVATTFGLMLGQSTRFGHVFPWSLAGQLIAPSPVHVATALWIGGVGGLLVLAAGLLDFSRREMD